MDPLGLRDLLRRGREFRRHPARLRVHRHARNDRDRHPVPEQRLRRQHLPARLRDLVAARRGADVPLLPDPSHDPRDLARNRRPSRRVERGIGQSRREPVPVLATHRVPGADALDPRRGDPALRKLVRRVCDGILPDERHRSPARPDPDRQRPDRRRALEPARGAGARLRDVRRPRGDDALLHPAATAGIAVGEVNRKRIAPSAVVWLLLGATYFLIPLLATLLFSLKDAQTGKCCSLSAYGDILHDPQFWSTIKISFRLALETIVVGLILFVPTIYWVHLKVPRLRPIVGFMALVPFVIPPIILVVGLLKFFKDTLHAPFWFLGKPDLFLVGAYVILAFPYIYFSLDAGFRSIDVHTLTEASRGLGASWRTTLSRVILPNIRVAALSGAFLTLAIVMGEFTIASLSAFHTFPTYLQQINQSKAYPAAAATLMSFMITWAAMLSILLIGRRGGQRTVRVGIGR